MTNVIQESIVKNARYYYFSILILSTSLVAFSLFVIPPSSTVAVAKAVEHTTKCGL